MLMDIFFQNLDHKKKRRLHFHDFMREMHRQIFLIGKNKKNKDPIETAVENGVNEQKTPTTGIGKPWS